MRKEMIMMYLITIIFMGIVIYRYKSKQVNEENIFSDDELDNLIGLDKLDLYYEVHMVGIDGECFNYSIYFDEYNDKKFDEINGVIEEFEFNYTNKFYIGYIDVTKDGDKVNIFLDLGNVDLRYHNDVIQGILTTINKVSGIKRVIINEDI